jgi:hypothetical protein
MNPPWTRALVGVENQLTFSRGSRLAVLSLLLAYPLTSTSLEPTPNTQGTGQVLPTAIAVSSRVAGKYLRRGHPGDFLEFNSDGTCSGSQAGHSFRGNYKVQGDTIITTSPQFPGREDRARISGNTITDSDGIMWEKPQDAASTARAGADSGPSMKQLEKWIKRELPSMGDDHIITKSKDRTYGMTYRMPKAELDDCVLTIRQELRFDDMESGQLRTTTLPLKDLDLAKLRTFEDSPSEGYTKNKPSYGVTLSALPDRGAPFRVQTKGMGVDKAESTARERVRVREQAMGLQLEGNLRRAAVLCGAPEAPAVPIASTTPAPDKSPAASTVSTSATTSSKMTNADVIQLVNAGLSELVIANSIRQAPERGFDLSPAGLVALKKAKVSDSLIVVMQSGPVAPAAAPAPAATKPPLYDPSLTRSYAAEKAAAAVAATGCSGVELMGIYQSDMRPVSPLIMHFAKVRNGTSVTRIVNVEWLDYYGQEMTAHAEVGAGAIATIQLSVQSPSNRAPTALKLASCQ